MFTTKQALKLLKKHNGLEAICVEGETEFGSCVDFRLTYIDGELDCEEPPNDWDSISYGCTEESIPNHLKWVIDISNKED